MSVQMGSTPLSPAGVQRVVVALTGQGTDTAVLLVGPYGASRRYRLPFGIQGAEPAGSCLRRTVHNELGLAMVGERYIGEMNDAHASPSPWVRMVHLVDVAGPKTRSGITGRRVVRVLDLPQTTLESDLPLIEGAVAVRQRFFPSFQFEYWGTSGEDERRAFQEVLITDRPYGRPVPLAECVGMFARDYRASLPFDWHNRQLWRMLVDGQPPIVVAEARCGLE